jgi:phosphate transport system permease protein
MNNKYSARHRQDLLMKAMVYMFSSVGAIFLFLIIQYVVTTGVSLVSLDLILGDSRAINTSVVVETTDGPYALMEELEAGVFYSPKWGIGLIDGINREGNKIVEIGYVHPDSPFNSAVDQTQVDEEGNPIIWQLEDGIQVITGFTDTDFFITQDGPQTISEKIEAANVIERFTIQQEGGGIRGSIITTLWLIVMTLAISVPIGVASAIYFNEFAKYSRVTKVIRTMVDLLTGVPSIIYGLLGAGLFIPILNSTINTAGGSVIAGALTLSVILLPTIIKSTEEALKVISDDLRKGSLALGASKTQTVFQIVLPNAVPGVLTGVLLGIGRIIGESAALIFAVGAAIKDDIILTERATSLAVHIWTVMGGEAPNYELASAIAIIILGVVFVMNFIVKRIASNLNKASY